MAVQRFNPRPPCGGRRGEAPTSDIETFEFQSAPPVRGATGVVASGAYDTATEFQSAPPVRGATSVTYVAAVRAAEFQSAPPVRGATRGGPYHVADELVVSIRAPRAGGDWLAWCCCGKRSRRCFNPRPPCGGRPPATRSARRKGLRVSIRAPRAGGDAAARKVRRRAWPVSIRAPRAGGDAPASAAARSAAEVSIRAPRAGGDRRKGSGISLTASKFQSAPPVRGATYSWRYVGA